MPVATMAHQLADALLGGDGELEQFVSERRADGLSWRVISRELHAEIGVDLSDETLRSWFSEEAEAS